MVSTEVSVNPERSKISTSLVESNNLVMRMRCRRLTRLVNAYSKKLENLNAAIALHFCHYNFVARHGTIKTCPAVAAGIIDQPWKIEDLLPPSN